MKKHLIYSVSLIVFSLFNVNAQEKKFDMKKKQEEQLSLIDKYCAAQKGEKIIILSGDKELNSEIKLDNGSIIKPDGIMLKSDSTQIVLKDGDCVDKEGNIVKTMVRKEE